MPSIFQAALKATLENEGLYSNDNFDNGGKTKFGITEREARFNGYEGEMIDFPLDLAEKIYKKHYWDAANLDQVANYSIAIALEVFDSGVNCGVTRACKWLQQAINCVSHNTPLVIDGNIGADTLVKLKTLRHYLDIATLIKMMNVYQGQHYIDICTRNESQKRFIKGWFKRVEFKV